MPWGLKRYQDTGDLHFITFSCYHRQPFLSTPHACRVFEQTLEDVRRWYGLYVKGYVVMPEHVHLLVSEPERSSLRVALQMLKQIVAQKLKPQFAGIAGCGHGCPILPASAGGWAQALLAGPVLRLQRQDAQEADREAALPPPKPGPSWASRETGGLAMEQLPPLRNRVEGVVEIESEWTGRKRERMGMPLRLKIAAQPVTFGERSTATAGPTLPLKREGRGTRS